MSIPHLPNIKPALLDIPTLGKLEPVGDLSHRPRILMLYGSLRERSFSRFLTEEAGRILEHLGAEVKIFNPLELPMAGSVPEDHARSSSCASYACGPRGKSGAAPSGTVPSPP